MDRSRRIGIAVVVAIGVLGAVVGMGVSMFPPFFGTSQVTVTLMADGTAVEKVDAEVANTGSELRTGLSEHESLAPGEGMLFVHATAGRQTYVMRSMNFGIDIVFIDSTCEVTALHTASPPTSNETGTEPHHRYTGHAKYVLEVPRGYAVERIDVGDRVSIPDAC